MIGVKLHHIPNGPETITAVWLNLNYKDVTINDVEDVIRKFGHLHPLTMLIHSSNVVAHCNDGSYWWKSNCGLTHMPVDGVKKKRCKRNEDYS